MGQNGGDYQIQLVVRDEDLKIGRGKRHPHMVRSSEVGPDTFLTEAEIVIELKGGRRFLVPRTRGAEDARQSLRLVPVG